MTKRRQIAIAYTFAIPVLFAFLVFEVGALYRLDAHEQQIAQDSAVSRECDSVQSALHDAEAAAHGYASSGSGSFQASYADASSRVNASLARLDDLSKTDPAMQAKVRSLRELAYSQSELFERAIDARSSKRAAEINSALAAQGASMTAEIEQIVAGIRADIQARSQQEQANAASSASTVDGLVRYGGVVTIWIVGVAALLLFYDDSERFRRRVEKRLHTDILESLPLPVCLTTETGSILYVNPAAEAAFGYRPGELIARNIALLHDANGGMEPSLAEVFARLSPHEMWCGQLPIRTIAGVLAVVVFVILIFRMRKSTSR